MNKSGMYYPLRRRFLDEASHVFIPHNHDDPPVMISGLIYWVVTREQAQKAIEDSCK